MKRPTFVDIIIFIISLSISILSFTLYTTLDGALEVHVTSGGKEWVYDLSVDTTETFTGPVGTTTMEIKNNSVHVHDSDCKNQICVLMGWISKPGEWVACLPNNVFIVIQGTVEEAEGETADEISY
ncbi:MAG: NusG domain II-containing protein [Sphaerochaetaceae bacterium]|nr:NusG domain II-containing protein [Sphaerochaetaceae bacterium]